MSRADAPAHAALLVVDIQNDFCAGGALAVANADRVVRAMNAYIHDAVARGLPVYASRDWHPAESTHFKPQGGPWPVHCVQQSPGARFHPDLQLPSAAIVVDKGDERTSSGYSAFDGHTTTGKGFGSDLQDRGINHLFVGGLATDYCVKHSVLDALSAGLRVTLLEDAVAGVDQADAVAAIAEMQARGAQVVSGAHALSNPA